VSCFQQQKQKHRRLFSRSSFLLKTHRRPRRRHRKQQLFVVVKSSTTQRENDPNNSELLLVAVAVGVTTGLAVSAFNLAESHVHASVFDFTFQTFLVAPSETDVDVLTTETTNEMLLNKFQTLSQNSGNASFVSHSLQVIVPTLGGCVVSALRDVAGGSFLGEEAVGTATSRAATAAAAVSTREEENKNATKTSSVVVEDVKKTVLKTVAAVVTLGTGASLGPEGPSVEIGAAVSSGVGRVASYFELKAFGVDEKKSINNNNNNNINGNSNISSSVGNVGLLAAGAAAGLSAGFGAPIAGLFFGFESVLARNSTYTFGQQQFNNASTTEMVIVAAVLAGTMTNLLLGESPSFNVPPFELLTLAELPLYLPLGLLCGATAIIFRGVSNRTTDLAGFLSDSHAKSGFGIPRYAQAPLGGFALGIFSIFYPEVSYNGFDNVNALLTTDVLQIYKPELLVQLIAAKLLATSLCRSSGLVGGVYAPSLFMGAALGASYGGFLAHMDSMSNLIEVAPPQAYALVGMAGVLASVCRVPLTAILLLFELTGNAKIILPLMGTVGVASWAVKSADAWFDTQQTAGLIFEEASMDSGDGFANASFDEFAKIDDRESKSATSIYDNFARVGFEGTETETTTTSTTRRSAAAKVLHESAALVDVSKTCAKVYKDAKLKDVAKKMMEERHVGSLATTSHAIVYDKFIEESAAYKTPIGVISVVALANAVDGNKDGYYDVEMKAKDVMEPIGCILSAEETMETNMNRFKQAECEIGVIFSDDGDIKALIDLREFTVFESSNRVADFANEK
jgi:H+/Cl- antiporter ClcA